MKRENYIIQPSWFRLDGGAMFGIIPKPLWERKKPADELNRINLALRLWLIKTNDNVILIDTGIGDYHDEKFNKNFDVRTDADPLESALNSIGLKTTDITDLIISHLHFDHIGGLVKKTSDGVTPALPHVQCHLHQKHYDYSLNPTARDKGSFHHHIYDPVINYYKENNQLSLYKEEEGEFFALDNNVTLKYRCSHGHTPWMMHPYDDQFIYCADLIPTSAHIPIPWVMGYDISPGVTTEDKKSFLNFIEKKNLKLIYEHDDIYWGSTIIKNEKGQNILGDGFNSQDKKAYQID
jgi:glyoxylase-like metal-dependent hydrolase (beta-lactamase superfamily II)